ncbi:MAG: sugar phosphate nucleotidyltransferase [bacterium]|nr:sugar phosphate nucleotidyltransferase [bacterium]
MYPIIMAGGAGTRLWPVSRKNKPKQIYPLIDKSTLLQKTWQRLRGGFKAKDIYLTTSRVILQEIKQQLPELEEKNVCLEPARRDTAAALGLALLKIFKRDPNGVFVYVNADNFVRDKKEFLRKLKTAGKVIKEKPEQTILIGVNPSYPETGYGYIKIGKPILKSKVNPPAGGQKSKVTRDEAFEVDEFKEKPDLATAKRYLSSWEYLWNPTLIVARVDQFLNFYKKYLPATWQILAKISPAMDTAKEAVILNKEFLKIKPISVDYGILEPAARDKKLLVLPADFGWSDVGHWLAVKNILTGKKARNICKGAKCIALDSKDNLIYSMTGKLVALAGVSNMIVIETEDALLICPKDRAQEVKKLVNELERRKLKEYL